MYKKDTCFCIGLLLFKWSQVQLSDFVVMRFSHQNGDFHQNRIDWCAYEQLRPIKTEATRVRASLASLRCGPLAVLVQLRKTRPCLTERLLMGRKESNQTNKRNN